jgi:hypothetical protein
MSIPAFRFLPSLGLDSSEQALNASRSSARGPPQSRLPSQHQAIRGHFLSERALAVTLFAGIRIGRGIMRGAGMP